MSTVLFSGPVTRAEYNRKPLGGGRTGDTQNESAAEKSAGIAVMSMWTRISKECFQHLVESMP